MKILDLIIKENFDFDGGAPSSGVNPVNISVADLNSLQLRTLNRLKDGLVDLENASDKELGIIMDLIDLGLVDDDGNVTDSGLSAAEEPTTNITINSDGGIGDDFADDSDDEIDFSIGDKF